MFPLVFYTIQKGINVNLGLKVNLGFDFLRRGVGIRVRLLSGFISI